MMKLKLYHYLLLTGFLFLGISANAQYTMVVGKYTGDANATKAITGVGFQPDVVIIKADAAQEAYISTSTMGANLSKGMIGAAAPVANMIVSLNADGFTVGNNAAVNGTGTTFYWVAFDENANMDVGSYTGDGYTYRKIYGVGFRPTYALLMPGNTQKLQQLFLYASTETRFLRLDDVDFQVDINTGVSNTDGFDVTTYSNAPSNTNAVTYHYVAWKAVAGEMEAGIYTANGADDRNLTLGGSYEPIFLIVKGRCRFGVMRNGAHSGDNSSYFSATANLSQQPVTRSVHTLQQIQQITPYLITNMEEMQPLQWVTGERIPLTLHLLLREMLLMYTAMPRSAVPLRPCP